jgi:hypothetical protein
MLIELHPSTDPSRVVSEALGALVDLTVDLHLTRDGRSGGYPTVDVHVLRVDGDGDLVICETDANGTPITNSTWAVPQELIERVVVPLGDNA